MKLPDNLKINVCTRKQNLALLEYNISFQTGLHSELTNNFTNSGPSEATAPIKITEESALNPLSFTNKL